MQQIKKRVIHEMNYEKNTMKSNDYINPSSVNLLLYINIDDILIRMLQC